MTYFGTTVDGVMYVNPAVESAFCDMRLFRSAFTSPLPLLTMLLVFQTMSQALSRTCP